MAVNAQLATSGPGRLTDEEFGKLRDLIYELAGIKLADGKKDLVYRRLSGRVTKLGLDSFSAYYDYLMQDSQNELQSFCDSLTTNFTSFFREQHHFDFLQQQYLPGLTETASRRDKRLRIWSAGCSSGEEPYSIAITLRDHFRDLDSWDAKILATDLDTQVIETCKAGVYTDERLEKVPPAARKRWFSANAAQPGTFRVSPRLQSLITFKQLNLMSPWPMKGPFDMIFCRNVIIYFDKQTQARLVDRFADLLADGGYLVIGHSESLLNVSERFELTGKTVHRKIR